MSEYILCFVLTCVFLTGRAQDLFEDDAGFWLSVKTNWKVHKKWRAELDGQLRWMENLSVLSRSSVKAGMTYQPKKFLKMLGGVLISEKNSVETTRLRYRWYAGVLIKVKYNDWSFFLRDLIQEQTRLGEPSHSVLRNRSRITASYKISRRYNAELSHEVYTDLQGTINAPMVSRQRTIAELIFHISKKVDLSFYYLFQRHYSYRGQPQRDFVTGLTVSFDFL